jgi:hypothetical protein
MKQFASWFTHGVTGGAALRKSIYEAKTGPAVLEAVERFFEQRLSNENNSAVEDITPEPELIADPAWG